MAEDESPLIKALPPASDYMTYLTIVEYNLNLDALPTLHKVLQDETLTTNIGWDLVHLLVPYLPDSEQCLQDIARLGNPREVILKVTESLRLIEYEEDDDTDEHDSAGVESDDVRARASSSTYPLKTAPATGSGRPAVTSSQAVEMPPPMPLPVNQFIALLGMLSILHTRIKTKHPSRFLSTTLQAILASFSRSTSAHREEMLLAVVRTVRAITGIKRPTLPNRQSSGMMTALSGAKTNESAADDPEGSSDLEPSLEEKQLQMRLIQSFITHVLEEYLLNLPSTEMVPGMAWCSRIMEKLHPERTLDESASMTARFAAEKDLLRRVDTLGQLVTIAQDLRIGDRDLLHAALMEEKLPEQTEDDEDDPPGSAEEVELSKLGSLQLYAARQVSAVLYDSPRQSSNKRLSIFPEHQQILAHCLSSTHQGRGTLGTEPEGLIDATLALGLIALENDAVGEPGSDEDFTEYLQTTALLSSACPIPNLRGHAHYLTTTVLRSQPDENVRLAFIRDTLEHCPFENLKVSAVGWIKGETIDSNPPTPLPPTNDDDTASNTHRDSPSTLSSSIFATPLALDSIAPHLFPALHTDLLTSPIQEAWITFRANLSFYLASLNFLYLLLCAKHVHDTLSIQDLWTNNDIAGSFLQPLREGSARFKTALGVEEEGAGKGELEEERSNGTIAELNVLDATVAKVLAAVKFLNE